MKTTANGNYKRTLQTENSKKLKKKIYKKKKIKDKI